MLDAQHVMQSCRFNAAFATFSLLQDHFPENLFASVGVSVMILSEVSACMFWLVHALLSNPSFLKMVYFALFCGPIIGLVLNCINVSP